MIGLGRFGRTHGALAGSARGGDRSDLAPEPRAFVLGPIPTALSWSPLASPQAGRDHERRIGHRSRVPISSGADTVSVSGMACRLSRGSVPDKWPFYGKVEQWDSRRGGYIDMSYDRVEQ